ncbi:DUF6790 family protein [Legionella jamestowniensis]|uniref:Transmembrane protein n=1 Tax=Legionella jamestowniensis TaxID=455 RepID=A0A0W0UGG3_9GAMM|nr:DUF6790 family protein [Legionella jamestowniensis]KTD06920.1 hypothetical protein Ljam_1115 [Legionella jamestowniensis]OCH97443.1 hypothetical protein A8135_02925 [Legionella jamestowniensis]SFL85098.1 hypothetical protein SAMN02746073_2253 [Legionella jamestowniensis DSM 19215]
MEEIISLALRNFTWTLFILSMIVACLVLLFKPKPLSKAKIIDIFFSYFLLFNVGISYLYNFIMHVFFGDFTAQFIGWAQSPFQLEVGFASLGFSIVGILSFWSGFGFRAATLIGPAMFLWGAAGGHIYQMVTANNFAPGNAGSIFWSDILIPIIGFILLWLQYKNPKQDN